MSDILTLPLTREILLKFFQSLDESLVDTRFMTVALLAFAGFLIDVLSSLKLKDLVSHATYFELFIEHSKTDQRWVRRGLLREPINCFHILDL